MELMSRSLSAKVKAAPLPGSFRKPAKDGYVGYRNYESVNEQQDEELSGDAGDWTVRSVPERRRIVEYVEWDYFLSSASEEGEPQQAQKVTIDLGLTPSYKREGGGNYLIRAELFDILWDSDMWANDGSCRGGFIDCLEIKFQPLWSSKGSGGEIVAGNLFPAASNTSAYFGSATQASISGFISRNPMIGGTLSKTHSQQTAQPMYVCRWERGQNGVVSFTWKLNLWCPSNIEYPKLYGSNWTGSKVPMLPPDYEKGNFNGLDIKPKVEWVVPASVVRAGRVAWKVTVNATLSMLSSRKGVLFSTKKEWVRQSFSQSEEWKFCKKTSGHIEDWQPTSASIRCCRASTNQCHHHHSCRQVQ